jgi:hypothetical protein
VSLREEEEASVLDFSILRAQEQSNHHYQNHQRHAPTQKNYPTVRYNNKTIKKNKREKKPVVHGHDE